jgi:hypothetical protein
MLAENVQPSGAPRSNADLREILEILIGGNLSLLD